VYEVPVQVPRQKPTFLHIPVSQLQLCDPSTVKISPPHNFPPTFLIVSISLKGLCNGSQLSYEKVW
jgi:hypothetical protein